MGAITRAPRRPGVVLDTGMCARSLLGNREVSWSASASMLAALRHRQSAAHAGTHRLGQARLRGCFGENHQKVQRHDPYIVSGPLHGRLARQNKFDPGKVVSIEADVTRITYDFAGG